MARSPVSPVTEPARVSDCVLLMLISAGFRSGFYFIIMTPVKHINFARLQTGMATRKATLYTFFYYPALFSLFYRLLVGSRVPWKDFFENLIFTCLFLLFSNLLRRRRLRFFFLLFTLVFLYLTIFVEVAYAYLYKNPISESTVFILLETNFSEARDFISMYFDKHLFFLFLGFFLPLLSSLFLLRRFLPAGGYFHAFPAANKSQHKRVQLVSLLLIVLGCSILLGTRLRNKNIVFVVYKSLKTYRKEANAYKLLGQEKMGGKFSNVVSDNQDEELYVLIIGESTTRNHMSLYNYYRNTNPLLSAKKDELIVYQDVISPHTQTIPSLKKVLTLADFENPEGYKDGTLLQLMNKAGFATYWVSNQCPLGTYETLVTQLAKSAGKHYFTNTATWESKTPYDEKLLIPFKEVLAEKTKKKFVVLHLMGTHGSYDNRFPRSFAKFHSVPATKFKTEYAYQSINDYDDAVLYNDYFVNSVLDLVKQQAKKSWVLYLSDHGEEVFDTMPVAEHLEKKGSKPMYEIPFIIWRSDKYKQHDNHQYITDRKYMTDDLIYTVADMSGVRFSEFDSTRSLVSPGFRMRKRSISKTEDFDTKFGTKQK